MANPILHQAAGSHSSSCILLTSRSRFQPGQSDGCRGAGLGTALLPSSCSPGTGVSWALAQPQLGGHQEVPRGQQPWEPSAPFFQGQLSLLGLGQQESSWSFPFIDAKGNKPHRQLPLRSWLWIHPLVHLPRYSLHPSPPPSAPGEAHLQLGHLLGTPGSPLPSAGHGWHPTAPHTLPPPQG